MIISIKASVADEVANRVNAPGDVVDEEDANYRITRLRELELALRAS